MHLNAICSSQHTILVAAKIDSYESSFHTDSLLSPLLGLRLKLKKVIKRHQKQIRGHLSVIIELRREMKRPLRARFQGTGCCIKIDVVYMLLDAHRKCRQPWKDSQKTKSISTYRILFSFGNS